MSIDLLNSLVSDTEAAVATVQAEVKAAETEYSALLESADSLKREYDRLLSWADLYDNSTFEAKKMIVSQFVKAVRVARDYNIEIDFNVSFEEFKTYCVENGESVSFQPSELLTA